MTDSRSELMALADELAALDFPWKSIGADDCLREWSITSDERDLVLSALRLAASQPDREMVARIIDPEAWSIDPWNDNWRHPDQENA